MKPRLSVKLTYTATRKRAIKLGTTLKKMLLMNMSQFANHGYAAGSARMGELKLLQRFVAALATNEGVQSKRREILQRLKSLSPREVDVLCYVLGGLLNREIAAELGLGLRTIKAHRGSAMKKLGVRQLLNYSQWCGVC